jgi:hypothetical protein
VSGSRLGRQSSTGAEARTQPSRIRDSTSTYIRCFELRRAGRTVRERLGVGPADPCNGVFSVMLLQSTDDCAGGKADGSCDNGLRCAATALIHARVMERCAIGARSRDFRRVAGPASVTRFSVFAGHRVFTVCCMFTECRMFTMCRVLNMGTGGHVGTGHTG